MSYILFCKGKRAEKPYFVADIRKKIYTIEELCYYLYHNTTLCGEELVKIQLANWIGHQLGFMDLFESILSILRKDPRPEKVASQIFAYTNYLTKPEREAVCERIRKNSLLSLNERRKMRADYYVVEKNYREAIQDYEEILEQKDYNTQKEKHHIMYNIGCCYSYMFYFDLAFEWFMKAAEMEIDQKGDLKAALLCKNMMMTDEAFGEFIKKHSEFEQISAELSCDIAEAKHDFLKEPDTVKLLSFSQGTNGRNQEYRDFVLEKIAEYKAES